MYKILKKNIFESGEYKIVPVRYEDRYKIMKWRNEQIYHLRQVSPLTKSIQNKYFDNIIQNQFGQNNPNQILFSFFKNNVCIGYGGLVHINWVDKNAEISFVMNTKLEKKSFISLWYAFLGLIEEVAFDELKFHKIFTYAFDLRPKLYEALEKCSFYKDAILKEHCFFDNKYIDVIIHSKINKK